jgi:hypothetical protein
MRLARICWVMAAGVLSFSLKTDSMTESSVEVVSCPVKAHQSFTTMPVKIKIRSIYYKCFRAGILLKVWWQDATLFVYFFIFFYNIHTFIHSTTFIQYTYPSPIR